jgi:hypothetical protein
MDPHVLDPGYPYKYYGLGSPTLNVLFPLSPGQYVSFATGGPDGYAELSARPDGGREQVELLNWLIASQCDDSIVASENVIKDEWFGDVPNVDPGS